MEASGQDEAAMPVIEVPAVKPSVKPLPAEPVSVSETVVYGPGHNPIPSMLVVRETSIVEETESPAEAFSTETEEEPDPLTDVLTEGLSAEDMQAASYDTPAETPEEPSEFTDWSAETSETSAFDQEADAFAGLEEISSDETEESDVLTPKGSLQEQLQEFIGPDVKVEFTDDVESLLDAQEDLQGDGLSGEAETPLPVTADGSKELYGEDAFFDMTDTSAPAEGAFDEDVFFDTTVSPAVSAAPPAEPRQAAADDAFYDVGMFTRHA
jgi:hypothetical protein